MEPNENDTKEPIHETETDSKISKRNLTITGYRGGDVAVRDKVGGWD